jgi:signal transduction histidine kinase
VQALLDYARSGEVADYRRFEQALKVPLADRQAREALDTRPPDLDSARAGLLGGDNHPDDVEGMVFLYRRFSHLPVFQEPLRHWREGDALIDELRTAGARLQAEAARLVPDEALRQGLLAEVSVINERLLAAERGFSRSIGEVGRLVERLLVASLLALAALVAAAGFFGVRRNLQARARREAELQDANERWRLAAEGGGLGMYDWDVEQDLLRLDARAAALYGVAPAPGEPAAVRRATVTALLHPDDLATTRAAVDSAVAGGQLLRARYRVQLPQGGLRHLEVTGLVQHSGDGTRRRTRMVGVLRDVTEEERQAEVAHERDTAERTARARMEFLSRLSHELRTPLNAILGFAQLMEMDGGAKPLPPQQAERVRRILDSGRQLLGLVDDVLDITLIDAGGVQVRPQVVDVAEVVAHGVAQVDGLAATHGVQVHVELPPAPLQVRADRQRLQQVLLNLLSNACKYNRRGGQVRVQVRPAGERVLLSVADTGPGIAERDQAALFQPFRRLQATATQVEGTGLGLFIVKQLVERMEGHIRLDSVPGQGSRFSVELPRVLQPVPVPPDSEADQARNWP